MDLLGMGKGHAWVNGKSIGRYWPSYLANENDCSSHCDFRGAYYDNKCVTNCGKPTQRWYVFEFLGIERKLYNMIVSSEKKVMIV